MNKPVCRTLFLFGFPFLLLGLTLSAVAQDESSPTVVSVNGQGLVSNTPDIAGLQLSVTRRGDTASTLKEEVDQVVLEVVEAAEDLGISGHDLQAAQVSVNPYSGQNPAAGLREQMGVEVHRGITVTIRDLMVYPELIDIALAAGVDQIGHLQLGISNRAEALERAVELAVEEAMDHARLVAEQLGLEVGRVQEIGVNPSRPRMRDGSTVVYASLSSANATFREGGIITEARVSMTVELLPSNEVQVSP